MENTDKAPWHGDEFHGQGGSYSFDPKSGRRALVERTESPKPADVGVTDQQPGAAGAEKE